MELNDLFGMLVFFCLFEVLGGGALGFAVRGIAQRDFSSLFFLIWGSGFGGIPLVIGAVNFLGAGEPSYFYAQVFVFVAAIVTVALLPRDLFQGDGDTTGAAGGVVVGAIMLMIGSVVVLLSFGNGIGLPLVIGAVFALLGAFLLFGAALRILRTM
jgi:hypothetical protein